MRKVSSALASAVGALARGILAYLAPLKSMDQTLRELLDVERKRLEVETLRLKVAMIQADITMPALLEAEETLQEPDGEAEILAQSDDELAMLEAMERAQEEKGGRPLTDDERQEILDFYRATRGRRGGD